MESSPKNNPVTLVGCLLLGLTAIAILLTLASIISRPDSEDEFVEGRVSDLVIVAPLWAAVAFLHARCRNYSNLRALILSSLAYFLLSSALLACNYAKYRIRNAANEQLPTQGLIERRTRSPP